MNRFPKDYDGILKKYDVNKAEPGKVRLIAPKDLHIEHIYVEGEQEGKTHFSIPAINLIKDCKDYEPEFILCYLPNEQKYATWDSDQWVLYTFENTSWSNIKENPLIFINAQWYDTANYELIDGWPV